MTGNKTSKEYMLEALRLNEDAKFPMPDLESMADASIKFDNALETFCESVRTAGGRVISPGEPSYDDGDFFRVEGEFGVAENGAVWINSIPQGAHRVDLFIHETLVIRLDKNKIVNNMHEAYRKLGEAVSGYGIFISGPSKTADIEQALVFGAHGPKALAVELY